MAELNTCTNSKIQVHSKDTHLATESVHADHRGAGLGGRVVRVGGAGDSQPVSGALQDEQYTVGIRNCVRSCWLTQNKCNFSGAATLHIIMFFLFCFVCPILST